MFACCCTPEDEKGGEDLLLQVSATDERRKFGQDKPATAEKDEAAPGEGASAKEVDPPTAAKAQAAAPKSFKVTLTRETARPRAPLGWRLDCVSKKHLYIFEVSGDQATPVYGYNAKAQEEKRINVGDYITSVNGSTQMELMTKLIEDDDVLELIVQQPKIFDISVNKDGQPLGLNLNYWPAGTALIVGDVTRGAVKSKGLDIISGDRIVSVSGVVGSSELLLNALRDGDTLDLRVSRCP